MREKKILKARGVERKALQVGGGEVSTVHARKKMSKRWKKDERRGARRRGIEGRAR